MKVCKICCVVGCKTVECKSGWCQWHHVHAGCRDEGIYTDVRWWKPSSIM